jgi:hypothetical protein
MLTAGDILIGYLMGVVAPVIAASLACVAFLRITRRRRWGGILTAVFCASMLVLIWLQLAPYFASRETARWSYIVGEYARPILALVLAMTL